MGSDQAKKLGADGRMDAMRFFPQNLYSPRSDPKHPDHGDWLNRTDPQDPEMVLLLASMRAHGTDEGAPVLVYSDGGRTCIAEGDRRQAACKIVNAERKTKREQPHRLRALTTADPILARALGNACRRGDPPMVIARRLRANMGALATDPDRPETGLSQAAAACGVTLRDARMLIRCLSLPAEIQAKIGAREDGIPIDVAAGMAKDGSHSAQAVVDAAKNPDGKTTRVGVRKAQKAARKAKSEAAPARAKTRPAPVLASIEQTVRASIPTMPGHEIDVERLTAYAEALRVAQGGDPPAWAKRFHDASEDERKAARKKGGGK